MKYPEPMADVIRTSRRLCLITAFMRCSNLFKKFAAQIVQRSRRGAAFFSSLIEVLLIGLLFCGCVLLIPLLLPSSRDDSANQAARKNDPIFRLTKTDDDRLFVQMGYQEIRAIDLLTRRTQSMFRTSGPPIARSRISRDGETIMLTLEDQEIVILRNGELLISHKVQEDAVPEISLSDDGRTAIVVSAGTQVRCWDLSQTEPRWNDYVITNRGLRVALTPDGARFVVLTDLGDVNLHDSRTGDRLTSLGQFPPVKSDLVFSDRGEWLTFASSQATFLIDMNAAKVAWKIPLADWHGPQHVAITRDGDLFAVGNGRMDILVMNRSNGEIVSRFKTDYHPHRLEFSISGDALYTANPNDGSIRIWSLKTEREQEPIEIAR